VKVKCCNCGVEHSAAFGGCHVQREAREAQRYSTIHDVSYAEAVKTIGRTTMRTDGAYMDRSGPTVGDGASDGLAGFRGPFRNLVLINVWCQRTL
jgi:hypothetical protein